MFELHWDIAEEIECPRCDAIHKLTPRQFSGWDWCPGFGFSKELIVECNDHTFNVSCDWDKFFNISVVDKS